MSVPERDDVEIIVVDDASGEHYKEEIESACSSRRTQTRIVFLTENGGGGKARNEGMKIARGKWVVFLDADDMFNYCINAAMDDYADCDADIIFFRASSIDNDTYLPLRRADRVNSCVEAALNGTSDSDYLLRYRQGCPIGKLIRMDFLKEHNIWFEEIRKHNDVRFAYTSGYYAKKMSVDPRAIYCITSRGDSVSMDISAEARLLRVSVAIRGIEFHQKHGVAIDELSYNILFDTMAEIYEKDKSVYEKGLQMLRESSLDQKMVERRLGKALRNAKARRLLPAPVRRLIKSLFHIK